MRNRSNDCSPVRRSVLCGAMQRLHPAPLPRLVPEGIRMSMPRSAGTPMAGAVMIDLTALDSDDEDAPGRGWAGVGPASKRRRTSLQVCKCVRMLHV